jgi:hypothetical protein
MVDMESEFAPRIVNVEVDPWPNDRDQRDHVIVCPVWADVDRPNTGGWIVAKKYADRLVAAIKAGAACPNPRIVSGPHGKTSVLCEYAVGYNTDADLKKLGF